MTEKIVQLVDKDNNNLYPVAGSLKQGSVTTSTISDNAVTADKIDFSTMTKSFPTVTKTNVAIGYDTTISLARVANIVFAYSGTQARDFGAIRTRASLNEKMPAGYRPAYNSGTMIGSIQDFNGAQTFPSWEIMSDGSMYLSASQGGSCRFNVTGCWLTNDEWPSS